MQRSDRVGDEIRKVIADLIQNEIKDPRLPSLVSVVAVNASRDLSHARVYVSVLGDEQEKKNCAAALSSASGFIRREVAARVRLRTAPEIHFIFDDSIERGIRISRLIDEALGDQTGQQPKNEKD
ncbi:MAG: 30S ribosome-binding factor RbfA [Bacillota bacterium]|nr:30S ribosome-binding factor RbfA [Bacillota bacterium]